MLIHKPTIEEIKQARQIATNRAVRYLLGVNIDPKTKKSNEAGYGYLTAIQYLAPANLSGYQVCASASPGCVKACLHTAGMPNQKAKDTARIARTRFMIEDPINYDIFLYYELLKFDQKCQKEKKKPAVRLNGTSDVIWEKRSPWLFDWFSHMQYYDYTKHIKRMLKELPTNYHLTLSRSENNNDEVLQVLSANKNARVTVVFHKELPKTWNGFKVIDADKHDLRFLDKGGRICGLRAKGRGKKDESGFVI